MEHEADQTVKKVLEHLERRSIMICMKRIKFGRIFFLYEVENAEQVFTSLDAFHVLINVLKGRIVRYDFLKQEWTVTAEVGNETPVTVDSFCSQEIFHFQIA